MKQSILKKYLKQNQTTPMLNNNLSLYPAIFNLFIIYNTKIMYRNRNRLEREIVEAYHIDRGGLDVISEPSISLLDFELELMKEAMAG
jgi:hypothetical protein